MVRLKHYLIIGVGLAGLALLAVIVCDFIVNLDKSSAGEKASALGNIIGGTIGALGAAFAVYFMLKLQRDDETEKTSAAVLREVVELCKGPMAQLSACALIQSGQLAPPVSQLRQLFHVATPTIYPAIADRISRLPRATLVVTFYMQLQETMGMVGVIEGSEPPTKIVTGGHIQGLADLLISQCKIARMILDSAKPDEGHEAKLVAAQRAVMVRQLDEELAAARLIFPDAETFQIEQGATR
jgi:hypothetical protein